MTGRLLDISVCAEFEMFFEICLHFTEYESSEQCQVLSDPLTLKTPRKILEQTTIYFCFLFFRENNA